MVRFQLIRISSYAKIKLQMCWVNQRQCRSRQMWKIFTNSPSTLTFLSITKNDLAWLNNPFMASFNSLGCSLMLRTNYRYVESLNINVEVAKCENFSHIHLVHSLFVCNTKWPVLTHQSIHGKLSTHWCMSSYAKKNNRCVESRQVILYYRQIVSVLGEYVKNIHKLATSTLMLSDSTYL